MSRPPPRGPSAMLASGQLGLSISERRARKHDVGADREPEGVIAHDRYLDEHAKDREDYYNERSNKPKVHCAYLLGATTKRSKSCPHDRTRQCEISSQAQGHRVAPTLATRVLFRSWC
jgi:hypothetical protein